MAAAAAASSTTPSTTTSLTTSVGGSVGSVGGGGGSGGLSSTQLPMASAGASSSSVGASFGGTMSAGAASKAHPNLQMPIMNHQYLMGHGMPQFAYVSFPRTSGHRPIFMLLSREQNAAVSLF